MSETEAQKTTKAWWQRFIELSALIAVPPTLAYALGVVALWVQLSVHSSSEGEWSPWYGATMAYKPVAAGIGFNILLRAFSLTLVIGGALLLIGYLFVRLLKKRRPSDERLTDFMALIIPLTIPLSCILVGGLLAILGFPNQSVPKVPNLPTVGIPILMYLLSFYLLWVLNPEQRSLVKSMITYYPKALYGAIPVVGIVLVVAILTLFPGPLQLPCLTRHMTAGESVGEDVVLPKEKAEEPGFQIAEGRLLANAEGYWWVIDKNGRFTAIPRDSRYRMEVEEPFGEPVSRSDSNYSGPYEDAPYNPVQQCR